MSTYHTYLLDLCGGVGLLEPLNRLGIRRSPGGKVEFTLSGRSFTLSDP